MKNVRTSKFDYLFLLLIVVLFSGMVLSAQEGIPAEPDRGRSPVMVAKIGGKDRPLELTDLKIDVVIHGAVAETKMTMTFYNPHNRTLEGELYFPLPEGSTVSGYALDVNRKMVPGVAVEKKKARVVYETIVRRGVDPGIVEWVKGNNFRTRVYPFFPKKSRTIMVRYLSEINVSGGGSSIFYLPLDFKMKVKRFSLKIEVRKNTAKPVIQKGKATKLLFKRWEESYVAESLLKDFRLEEDVLIQLPASSQEPVQVEQAPDGQYYFIIADPEGPRALKHIAKQIVEDSKPVVPAKVTIFWDASGSMGKIDRTRELEVLRHYFSIASRDTVKVKLVLFRNRPEAPRYFTVKNRNCDSLITFLQSVQYDGGTDLSAVAPLRGRTPGVYLLFTDGNGNFGKSPPPRFKAPLYIFSKSASANHSYLRNLARKNGGDYFNLTTASTAQIEAVLKSRPLSFISATCKSGVVSGLYPREPVPVHNRFVLTGRLDTDEAQVTLNYGIRGKILKRVKYKISSKDIKKSESTLLQTFWAQKKIAALMVQPKRNKEELLETGKRFGLVTPGTSLMVLESLRQYVEFRIEPPKELPNLLSEYRRLMETRRKEQERDFNHKLERMVRLWHSRVAWWKKEFKIPPMKKKKRILRKQARTARHVAPVELPIEVEEDSVEGVEGGVTGGVMGADFGAESAGSNAASPPPPGRLAKGKRIKFKRKIVPQITLKGWNPDTPYIRALKGVKPANRFDEYMRQKKRFGTSPGFYLDCSDFFYSVKNRTLGLQVLSNIAELDIENHQLLRVLAHRLNQLDYLELSAMIFQRVLEIRPEEPQSYRDLALVLGRLKKYRRAVKLLYHVITSKWNRFADIEVIVLMELNQLIARAKAAGIKKFDVDPRLVKLLDVDVRILLTWDADNTDMDLWVIDPRGEKSFYGHKLSKIGGLMSKDFTRGYGPEEYVLKRAIRGIYKIKTKYYGSSSQKLLGPVTLQVEIFTNYGRKNQKRKSITLRLKKRDEIVTVGELLFKPNNNK